MKDSTKNTLKKVGYSVATAAMTASAFAPMAFAADAKAIMSKFLAYVCDMFLCVGVLLGVWAVAQLALSFKNEDADSKSKAMMMLVVAVILLSIKQLAKIVTDQANFTIGQGFLDIIPM